MSFHDGTPVGSVFDRMEMKDIIYVGESIMNQREYLYYFIGNCNITQQNTIRNEAIWRIHNLEQLCAKLPRSLLLFSLRMHHPDISTATHHSRYELLRQLNEYNLPMLIQHRRWNTSEPIFVDGTSVAATVQVHHKDVIVDALQAQRPTFPDGVLVHEEYNLITTSVLQWLCREYDTDMSVPSRLTRADCLYHLQFPQLNVFEISLTVDILPLHHAWEILDSLYDVPTEMKHRRDSFIQSCAVLLADIADTFVTEVRKDYNDRLHYSKRLHSNMETDTSCFLQPVQETCVCQRLTLAINRTTNHALQESPCVVCARIQNHTDMETMDIADIPHGYLLRPTQSHPSHILSNNMLLYGEELRPLNGEIQICRDCLRLLQRIELPRLALANDMWLGHIPSVLQILTLPERILIARYFPAAYIIKLYPKIKSAKMWDPSTLCSGIKGNTNNPLWSDIYINHQRLQQLPEDGVPTEIDNVTRVCHEMEVLAEEDTGYVPDSLDSDDTAFDDLYPNANDMNLLGEDTASNDKEGRIYSEDIVLYANAIRIIFLEHFPSYFPMGWEGSKQLAKSKYHMKFTPAGQCFMVTVNFAKTFILSFKYSESCKRETFVDLQFFKCIRVRINDTSPSSHLSNPMIYSMPPFKKRRKTPFTNPGVQALRTELIAVRSKVLEKHRGRHVFAREEGIFGTVQAYISTVEAQGRGSLHLHLLLWLRGSQTANEMEDTLKTTAFHDRVASFIDQNIIADIAGRKVDEILRLPEVKDVSYSRPPDPTAPDLLTGDWIPHVTRTVQLHQCHELRCWGSCGKPKEFSAQECMSYIMGWGERYISHFYAPIYLNGVRATLLRTFPELKNITSPAVPTIQDTSANLNANPNHEIVDDHVRLQFRDNVLMPKDQIREYEDRGLPLECLNLFDFLLNTYDTKKRTLDNSTSTDLQSSSSTTNENDTSFYNHELECNVNYLPTSGRNSHMRVIRRIGHETLPDFIVEGPWFPDVMSNPELHAAYILTIFKPWMTLHDLKPSSTTFYQELQTFLTVNPTLRSYCKKRESYGSSN
ncbi:hypothetical protein EDD18DRAFT_1107278 [Armillaria luteobubalina]|uniref:Helitron helicase-like domain-containing protein n=1 Tax=Armillaria luteobubalina TaxID=153913 RepID=A0AA39UV65_9AGAR|nr:hypothetical protein EDD18DRAFT_1107278 [Armillaria luteobubalina]